MRRSLENENSFVSQVQTGRNILTDVQVEKPNAFEKGPVIRDDSEGTLKKSSGSSKFSSYYFQSLCCRDGTEKSSDTSLYQICVTNNYDRRKSGAEDNVRPLLRTTGLRHNSERSVKRPKVPVWRRQLRSRVFRTTLLVVITHITFWFPYNLYSILRYIDVQLYEQMSDHANIFKDLQIVIAVVNPFLYGFSS